MDLSSNPVLEIKQEEIGEKYCCQTMELSNSNLTAITSPISVSGKSVYSTPVAYMPVSYFDCWGEFMLDGVYPFYCLLKDSDLLGRKFTIVCKESSRVYIHSWGKICQLLQTLFNPVEIFQTGHLSYTVFPTVYRCKDVESLSFFHTDERGRQIQSNLKLRFKEFGVVDNEILSAGQHTSSQLQSFIAYVVEKYGESATQPVDRLMTITERRGTRRIMNTDEIKKIFIEQGYLVEVVDFGTMSVKQQISQMRRSQYLLGNYGSNLLNGIFLPRNLTEDVGVIVCWPPDSKIFFSRRYSIIHSAIIALGISVYEVDKTSYEARDTYARLNIPDPSGYTYREGTAVKLHDKYRNHDSIMADPLPAHYDLLDVNFNVVETDIHGVIQRLSSKQNLVQL